MAVPWEENPDQWKALLDQARLATEAGRLADAAGLFRKAYDMEPTAYVASRYLHCMRRQGPEKARAAVRFARAPVERWPLDTWLIREYCWAIYDGYLRQHGEAEEDSSEGSAEPEASFEIKVKAARRILRLCSEDLPRTRAVFAICRLAKARRLWELVLEFAQALDSAKLSEEARQYQGRAILSDRQQWLSLVTRACLELERYDDALRHAQEGMERYPQGMFFPWWHALALVRQGRVQSGLRELEAVHRRFVEWYIRRDIAEAYELLKQDETAWHWYCVAAGSSGELKSRVPMLARMAEPLERLERWSLAFDHLLLAWTLAAREPGWEKLAERLHEQAAAFLQRRAAQLGRSEPLPVTPPDPAPLLTICRQSWTEARA